jgi:hypothetical protein
LTPRLRTLMEELARLEREQLREAGHE